jgi:SAM-dependent methyltransferase
MEDRQPHVHNGAVPRQHSCRQLDVNQSHTDYLASAEWANRLQTDLLPWLERGAALGDDVLEIGPGPGLTTDILRTRAQRVTAVEIDDALATSLADRLMGTNVEVLHRDASQLDFVTDRFSSATCFSVLHHIPTAAQQDEVLAEVLRVLQPGAPLIAVDARDLEMIRTGHHGDVFNPLDADTLSERLQGLGYRDVTLESAEYEIRFTARKPG